MGAAIFFRLLPFSDKGAALSEAVIAIREGVTSKSTVHAVRPTSFQQVPGSPFAYWVSERIRRLLTELPAFESEGRVAQHGASTKDDFRFLRAWWDVEPAATRKMWFPFAKGGAYSPFYADVYLVVNWADDARELEASLLQKYPYLGDTANAEACLANWTKSAGGRPKSASWPPLRSTPSSSRKGPVLRPRLFAEDAARGFAFIDLCRKRYDVVLMNPPFGEPSKPSKPYIVRAFPRTKNDLYAVSVERGLGMLKARGMLGAITSRTGFFLSSFTKWREEILLKEAKPTVFVDLGYGIMDAAMVEAAAYCLEAFR